MTDLPGNIDSNYLTLLDAVDAVIYVADFYTYELLFLNKMARDSSGGSIGSICWKTLQADQTGPCPFCTNDRLIDKNGHPTAPYVWEFQNTINGEWWECRDQAIRWVDGRLVRLEIATNITARKSADLARQKIEERYLQLFDNMSSGVAVFSATEDGQDFIIRDLNRAALKIEKVNKADVIGRRLTEVFPGVVEFGLFEVLQRVWRTGKTEQHPVTAYKDERIQGWRDNYVCKLPTGEVIAIYEDVTKQKQAEKDLLDQKESLSFALRAANSGMWDWNLANNTVTFDANYYTMAGYSAYEFPQTFEEWEKRVHPDDIDQVKTNVEQALKNPEQAFSAEFRFKTNHGNWTWIYAQGEVIERDSNGHPLRFIGLHTKIDQLKQTELALRESQERLDLTLKSAELGTWDWYPQTGEVVFNDRWAEMLGYQLEELVPHVDTWTKLLHPDDIPKTMSVLTAHLEGEIPIYQTEFRMRSKQGGWKWILDTGKVAQWDEHGQAVRVTGTHLDITERKQAEEALKISEEKYRNFFENSVVGIYQSSPEGRYLKVNKTFAEMLGFDSPEELVRSTTDIGSQFYIDPQDRDHYKKLLEEQGYAYNFIHRFRHRNGSQLWITTSSRRVCNTTDGSLYFEGIAIDITEQVEAEKALRESEENLLITLNSIGDAVIAVDTNHRVIRMNPVAEHLTGWSQTQATGKQLTEVFHIINLRTGHTAENPVEKVLDSGEIVALTNHTILIAKDGSESQIADSAAPIRNKEGHITGVVLVFRDVTEEYRIRDELQKMQQLESIGTLAGGIAHDFNNILAGIFGNIALAKQRTEKDHPGMKYLEQAEISANRAKNLTGQLLTFAKGGEPIKDQISLGDLIQEVAKFDLSGSKIKLIFKQSSEIWTAEVDRAQIQQVISNLVINAKQSMTGGGHLFIAVENYHHSGLHISELKPGNYIQVTVRDEGAGIDRKSLPHIFDPYFSTKSTGRGLGLATVYSVIKRHEGHVKVESVPGQGACFTLYLPAIDSIQQDADQNIRDTAEFEKRSLRVLLMDDEEIIRNLATEMISRLGGTTDTATNGEDTLEMYLAAQENNTPYDLVIMDLTVPGGMGGKEAIEKLLEIDPQARVIVSSGYADDPVMAQYKSFGFIGVAAKPYSFQELADIIRKALDN
ncbi:MAG: PAS domain S-box protein [Desulfuromonadales bacterium]|nr:PAS domain S-box protein [Desulfuromonadales bacterium]MBN2791823.1 PAS domain S-box protein [Desulfuromonadales bacterium]